MLGQQEPIRISNKKVDPVGYEAVKHQNIMLQHPTRWVPLIHGQPKQHLHSADPMALSTCSPCTPGTLEHTFLP